MARKLSVSTLRKKTIAAMQSLGTYRPEYNQVIEVYIKLIEQYEDLKNNLSMIDFITRTDGVLTLEKLRADIAKYSDMLCLNPKVFEKTKIKEAPKKSKLEAAMEALTDGGE